MLKAFGSGLLGAVALTVMHEATRRTVPHAPRMDVLGERAISRGLSAMGVSPPRGQQLHNAALVGDVVSNSLYYSMVGMSGPATAPACGALLGLIAGVGAVLLPGPLGLGNKPSNRTTETTAMTVGLYLAGGLAAGIAYCVTHAATVSDDD
jgi:hypothetical protein